MANLLTDVYCIGRKTDFGYEVRDENGNFRSTPTGDMPCKTRQWPINPSNTIEDAAVKAEKHGLEVIRCQYHIAFNSIKITQS